MLLGLSKGTAPCGQCGVILGTIANAFANEVFIDQTRTKVRGSKTIDIRVGA